MVYYDSFYWEPQVSINHSWLMQISRVIIEPYYCDDPSAKGKATGTILASPSYIEDIEDLLRIELYPSISSDSPSVCSFHSP